MSSTPTQSSPDQTNWPSWAKALLRWIGIGTAIIAAMTGLLAAAGKLGDAYQGACKAFGVCRSDAAKPPTSPQTAAVKPTPPVIPNADSGWIDGGSSPDRFCSPQLDAVRKQYPAFTIEMTVLPEQHRSEYTPFKHDIYRYQCAFSAIAK